MTITNTAKGELLAGPLQVYAAPVGTEIPEIDDLAPGAITIAPGSPWVNLGMTVEDFDLSYDPDYHEIRVNESNTVVKMVLIGEELTFEATLAQGALDKLQYTMSASDFSTKAAGEEQTAQSILGIGDAAQINRSILAIGVNPAGGSRVIVMHDTVVADSVSNTYGREHHGVSVAFSAIGDLDQDAGFRLATLYDITAPIVVD